MSTMHNRANLWWFTIFYISYCGCSDGPADSRREISRLSGDPQATFFSIVILGDSLTEGYGVSPAQAYPSILEKKLSSQNQAVPYPCKVINGGVTGSTTSGGASRIDWYLKSPPDFLIVALGGNDGLRGIPPAESKKNLRTIIARAQEKQVPVLLAGMKLPPNYGLPYTQEFESMFTELAEELNVPLLPFLLEGVGGNPNMNLPDLIHPNPSGHKIIAQTVYEYLIKHLPNKQS